MNKKIFALCLLSLTACTSISNLSGTGPESMKQEVKLINKNNLIGKEFVISDQSFQSKITIGFSKNRVYGFSGVNRYFASYKIIDNKLITDTIGSTLMAGPNSAMIEETKFLTLIKDNKNIKFENGYLILTSNEGIELKFKLITK